MSTKIDLQNVLPPLIFPGNSSQQRKQITLLKKQGRIRAIGPRLYTSTPKNKVAELVRGSWGIIISQLYPNALISHATALTYLPNASGEIFLTSKTQRNVQFPGLTLRFIRGPGPDKTDVQFMNVKASSFERALLENLSPAKGVLSSKRLPQSEIEHRLAVLLLTKGERELNKCRDRALAVANRLQMQSEFKRLDKIIGSLLGSRSNHLLENPQTKARSLGLPYDTECLQRLESLFAHLRHFPLSEIEESQPASSHFINKAFIESYFSNYIEGTLFEISEAESIVFDKKIPKNRPIDAHDIFATYKIVSNPNEMLLTPKSDRELLELLQKRHVILFKKRPEIFPGKFKTKNNRAGSTTFVPSDYITGTFQKGFELYWSLPEGLARSIFVMFLVSDIHPFNDGNGRISRIMMNAELYSKHLSTILIPTVYREDYLLSLRALTRRANPEPYTRMLMAAHKFSHLDFSNYMLIKQKLIQKNWFEDPSEAKLIL